MSYKKQRQPGYQIDFRRQNVRILQARGKGKSYPGIRVAQEAFESRSERSKGQDLVRLAKIAPNLECWLKDPSRWDLRDVDTPNAKRIFENRTTRQKAADLAKRAKLTGNVELWMNHINEMDMKGVDSPPKGKHVRRFRVLPKKEAEEAKKKRLDKQKELDHQFLDGKITKQDYERKRTEGHKLPSKTEIIERAQEIHKEELARQGLPVITAEEKELKESGSFEKARADLMRGEGTKADSAMLQYISDLRAELSPFGFDIIERD